MLSVLLILFFLLVMIGVMGMAYTRMISLRDMTQSRLDTDPEPLPRITPYVDEIRDENGLVYSKSMNFDADLSSADKRAAELPDIQQSLQGKR